MQAQNVYTDTTITAGTVPATNVETVAIVLPPGVSVDAGRLVVLEAAATWTTGAATVSITARIRRGATVAGALVGAPFVAVVGATSAVAIPLQCADTPGEVAGQQYCLTLQQGSATANGTGLFASLQASWLIP